MRTPLALLVLLLVGCRGIAGYQGAAPTPADGAMDAKVDRDGGVDGSQDARSSEGIAPQDLLATVHDLLASDHGEQGAVDLLASDGKLAGISCPPMSTLTGVTAPLLADTVIAPAAAAQGNEPAATVGGLASGVALLRFDLRRPAGALGPPIEFKLRLFPALWAVPCGSTAGCSPCGAPTESPGIVTLAYMTTVWAEDTATWNSPGAAKPPWVAPGAGLPDSSLPLAAALYQVNSGIVFESQRYPALSQQVDNWIDASDQLAFRVAAPPTTRMMLRLDSLQPLCSNMESQTAWLTVWYCVTP